MGSKFPVPRHLRNRGEDGYRTPTIEDAERTLSILGVPEAPNSVTRDLHTTALDAALQRVSSRQTATQEQKEYANGSGPNDATLNRTRTASTASALGWKGRIRHITWAYFTLTMATGGLANVLYEGNDSTIWRGFPH